MCNCDWKNISSNALFYPSSDANIQCVIRTVFTLEKFSYTVHTEQESDTEIYDNVNDIKYLLGSKVSVISLKSHIFFSKYKIKSFTVYLLYNRVILEKVISMPFKENACKYHLRIVFLD